MFPLGQTVITKSALNRALQFKIDAVELLHRHAAGDWGDLEPYDKALNKQALQFGNRLFSRYDVKGLTFYVITEHDRSVTTVMLSEDY